MNVLRKAVFTTGVIIAPFLGIWMGVMISCIGDRHDLGDLIARGLWFIVPLAGIAAFCSRWWLLPIVLYALGFHQGYGAFENFLNFGWPTTHAHPELFWYYDFGVLLVSIVAIMSARRMRSPGIPSAMTVDYKSKQL